jgi:hypothetical protein
MFRGNSMLSSHSIIVTNTLEIPLDMHSMISHMRTCKPMVDELDPYQARLIKLVEWTEDIPWEPYSKEFADRESTACAASSIITEDIPWEPYSKEFADRESTACAASSIMAVQATRNQTSSCLQEAIIHMNKAEEETVISQNDQVSFPRHHSICA